MQVLEHPYVCSTDQAQLDAEGSDAGGYQEKRLTNAKSTRDGISPSSAEVEQPDGVELQEIEFAG